MEFRIADTFTASLGRLNAQEQKAVKITAMDLQLEPASPGHVFHKLDRAQDRNFWSVRVNADIRLIVHRTESSLLLAYVDHHDAAYRWAERRRIERHPKTGAAQLVELRRRVEDRAEFSSAASSHLSFEQPSVVRQFHSYPFANTDDDTLLGFGVPGEWLEGVRRTPTDDLLDLAPHLPQEAMEALLQFATGGTPEPPPPIAADADPFSHPDAQRRFRTVASQEELERALEAPWEKWAVFLHPSQRRLVERRFNGPARVTGSAGTGKTIVALHRAVHLARRQPQAKLLLTTFSKALANALQARLRTLVGNEPAIADRITVRPLTGIGYELYTRAFGQPTLPLEQRRPDDEVGHPGLVLEGDEQHALGRARHLPHQHQAGDAGGAAVGHEVGLGAAPVALGSQLGTQEGHRVLPQRQPEMAIVLDDLAALGHRRQDRGRLVCPRQQGALALICGQEQRQRRVTQRLHRPQGLAAAQAQGMEGVGLGQAGEARCRHAGAAPQLSIHVNGVSPSRRPVGQHRR
ncbi:MAG TPA: UvrD-helicase domain-containing protein [Geminicoccaceae bacterium]|mgnify:CR=1 FL=1|nr:UvrD-helicase domain-containing protein [Geminicoccus sp.]HMU50112.1 UvrD-helicase domain-containing protein [Geminicoccaceae bacterium]